MNRSTGSGRHRNAVLMFFLTVFVASASVRAEEYDGKIVVPQTIRQPSSLDARLAPHYHFFVSVLEESGFKVGQTDDPRALDLRVGLDPNPRVSDVVASLWNQDTKLFGVRAAPGATLVGSPLAAVVERAVKKFETQLAEIRDSIVIVADEQPQDGS